MLKSVFQNADGQCYCVGPAVPLECNTWHDISDHINDDEDNNHYEDNDSNKNISNNNNSSSSNNNNN